MGYDDLLNTYYSTLNEIVERRRGLIEQLFPNHLAVAKRGRCKGKRGKIALTEVSQGQFGNVRFYPITERGTVALKGWNLGCVLLDNLSETELTASLLYYFEPVKEV